MRVFQQKEQKMPGAHKIGAAISGPRIAGGNFKDITLFLKNTDCGLQVGLRIEVTKRFGGLSLTILGKFCGWGFMMLQITSDVCVRVTAAQLPPESWLIMLASFRLSGLHRAPLPRQWQPQVLTNISVVRWERRHAPMRTFG